MLKILGLLAIMAAISAIVYKLFFSFRKKHIGSGNIFYVCANGTFNEALDIEKVHQENLHILTARSTETVNIMDGMITQNILSRDNHAQHRILINGMPVGHLTTGEEVSNIEDIQTAKGDFVQDAEIESSEVIFSKELTDYVENARKEWRNSYKQNNELLLEVGKRITKELLTNTEDNVDLIPQMEKQLQ